MKKLLILYLVFASGIITMAQQNDELAVKEVVKEFITAAGDYDFEAMKHVFAENANIGGASLRNGTWHSYTMTLTEFIEMLKDEKNPDKYKEPISNYIIHISEGQLAFVMADAEIVINGIPKRTNFDYFTLIKLEEKWKIINGSYVSIPIE